MSRKKPSLFDSNIKIKDMDDVELVLESSAIPESGTASVRARPTVKHHASSSDSFQGFAVPTPKVPLLPPVSGTKINGSVGEEHLSNGSVISVPDLMEGEIFVPPPPSMAPPPPPGTFIPLPPDFMGDLNSLDLANLQPPSMPAPKPPSHHLHSVDEENLTFLKPPPMAPPKPPPKPPSTCSSGSVSSLPISSPPPVKVPERPILSQTPVLREHKTPPQKPIRLSSISYPDSPPQTPAPPPTMQTLSTFNPQNTARLYSVPKTSILSGYEDRDPIPKQMLLLEDSGSVKSAPVLVQVKSPKVATPSKPVSKDVQEPKENLQITQLSQSPLPEPNKKAKTGTVSAPPEIDKPLQVPHKMSPQLQTMNGAWVDSEPSKEKLEGSPSQNRKFSPLLDRKLRNLKSDIHGAREGPATSPLALLLAAKERDKHKSTPSLSRENSAKNNEQLSARILPSDTNPNSFIVTPMSSSFSSPTSQEKIQESPKFVNSVIQTPEKSSSPALVKDQVPSTSPALNRMAAPQSATHQAEQKQNAEQSSSKSQSASHEDIKEELSVPLLPPPPEFDDLDKFMEPPPSIPPPDPPMKKAPTPTVSSLPTAQVPPPPPKPKPPAAPKLPPPDIDVKPKVQVQTKPKVVPSQLPDTLSPSQATLLSILQKKMLEMDNKMAPVMEAGTSSDDWGGPLSDEDKKIPVVPRTTPQSKNKAATLDMKELEDKLVRKKKETSSVKVPTSNGLRSKHQYGMTFTVRPGTKQPITLVSKGDS